jgi:glycosyltransferase involved in cell wall biosynthesis
VADRPLKVCHVVCYRDPRYVRTRNLRAALDAIDGVHVIDATNTRRGPARYLETLWKLLKARFRDAPDVYVLGFRGHEIFPFVRLLTIGKPLIFDEFMSPSDALLSEGKGGALGRLAGLMLYPLEWLCLRLSARCLTDTELHRDFIATRFGVPRDRIDVVYVGGIGSPGRSAGADADSQLHVLFYGTFLPLHGMDVLLRACKLVADKPIRFHIIGGAGRALDDFRVLLDELSPGNVVHDTWVDFAELQSRVIPSADLCLGGPFGGTPQARRVITGKTFQFLAQGKPTVIGRVDEPVPFADRENCLLVEQADVKSLAAAFEWAIEHRDRLPDIGLAGQRLFDDHFSTRALARQLEPALKAVS